MFTVRMQAFVRNIARSLAPALRAMGFSPNTLTFMGLVVTMIAAVCVGKGWLIAGGIILLLGAVFDILDGAVARVSNSVSSYGAFFDSTIDRYSEVAMYAGLLCYFLVHRSGFLLGPLLVMAALSGSMLVSYVRARAQSLGFTCEGGLFARPERVVATVIALVISPLLIWILWVLAVLTNITAVQRIWIVWRQARTSSHGTAEVPAPAPAAAVDGTTPSSARG